MGARWYDPTLGRFTQADPSGQETNPYLYAAGNPINGMDSTGLSVQSIIFGSLVGGMATAGALMFGAPVGGAALVGAFIGGAYDSMYSQQEDGGSVNYGRAAAEGATTAATSLLPGAWVLWQRLFDEFLTQLLAS